LAGGAVWKHRFCHCEALEASGRTVYDLRHAVESVGVAKADLAVRVAIRREEWWCIHVVHGQRDVTQVIGASLAEAQRALAACRISPDNSQTIIVKVAPSPSTNKTAAVPSSIDSDINN
jgi:hypothetical protein